MRDRVLLDRENTIAKMCQMTRALLSLDLLTDEYLARGYVEARDDVARELHARMKWTAPAPTVRSTVIDGVAVVRVLGTSVDGGDRPYVWGFVTVGRSQFSIASEEQLLAYLLSRYLPQESP